MPGDVDNAASAFLGEIEECFNGLLGQSKGTMVLAGILDRHGSQEMYIAKMPERMRQERDRQIKLMFKGDYKDLKARLESMGVKLKTRQLRRIVSD
jgi:hypothetical protein